MPGQKKIISLVFSSLYFEHVAWQDYDTYMLNCNEKQNATQRVIMVEFVPTYLVKSLCLLHGKDKNFLRFLIHIPSS